MIKIITVGKVRSKELAQLIEFYRKQIPRKTEIITLKDEANIDGMEKEGLAILKVIKPEDFVVTLEMDTDTTVSTGSDVVAALNAFEAFSNVAVATGTASVALTEVAKTKLSGGVDGTFAPSAGFYFVDQNFVYVAIKANEKSDSNWRRIAVGSAY